MTEVLRAGARKLLAQASKADAKPYGYGELGRYLQATLTYYARRYYGREQNAQIIVGR